MLRIVTRRTGNGGATLGLEGRLMGPWVDELERTCVALSDRALALDLAGVSFVERRGVHLLRSLDTRGVSLLHCTPFVAEQLRAQA